MTIVSVVLAAGASRRLGRPKQLVPFRGEPLVKRALAAVTIPEVTATAVVLGANGDLVASVLDDRAARIWNPSWKEGIASSIRMAVAWAEERRASALVIALADQPLIEPAHVTRLIAALRGAALASASTHSGVIGVPAAFDARLFSALRALDGDRGAAGILRGRSDVTMIPCPEAAIDIDTASDVDALASFAIAMPNATASASSDGRRPSEKGMP